MSAGTEGGRVAGGGAHRMNMTGLAVCGVVCRVQQM